MSNGVRKPKSLFATLLITMASPPPELKTLEDGVAQTTIEAPLRKERRIEKDGIVYITYTSEKQLEWITELMKKDLSEPYSVYTYRYFINNWPDLCWLVRNLTNS